MKRIKDRLRALEKKTKGRSQIRVVYNDEPEPTDVDHVIRIIDDLPEYPEGKSERF